MKRKSITLTICILAVLALASIGFASWIITNPSTGTKADGTIEVDNVTSEVFKIKSSWDDTSKGKIVFGKPSPYTEKATDWLKNSSENYQNLTADLTIEFQVKENVDLKGILKATPIAVTFKTLESGDLMAEDDESQFYSDLTLPKPVLTIKSGDNYVKFDGFINDTDIDAQNKCVIRVEFSWGTATGGENPYDYYNNIAFGTEFGEEGNKKAIEVIAEEYLRKLFEDFKGITYRITLDEHTAHTYVDGKCACGATE